MNSRRGSSGPSKRADAPWSAIDYIVCAGLPGHRLHIMDVHTPVSVSQCGLRLKFCYKMKKLAALHRTN